MTDQTSMEGGEDAALGWDAIDSALAPLYPDQEPRHFGTVIKWMLGGPDPLDGISAYKRTGPVPHWHIVTYGFSELYTKETSDPTVSGYGFELTFRLACDIADEDPPIWAMNFLQNLARYVFSSGNVFSDGEWMSANGPIASGRDTLIRSLVMLFDPELAPVDTVHGRLNFIQVVGITPDEELAAKRWNTRKLLEAMLPFMPLWVTDLDRDSFLGQPVIRQQLDAGSARDGSSSGSLHVQGLTWKREKRLLRAAATTITIGAASIGELSVLLPLRLPFGRPFHILSGASSVAFIPGDKDDVVEQDGVLEVHMTPPTVVALADTLQPKTGTYVVPGLPTLVWTVA